MGKGEGLCFVSGWRRALGLSLGTALWCGLHYRPVEGGAVAEAEEKLQETMATGSILGSLCTVHCSLEISISSPTSTLNSRLLGPTATQHHHQEL